MTDRASFRLGLDDARGSALHLTAGTVVTVLCREPATRARLKAAWGRRPMGERLSRLVGRRPVLALVESAPVRDAGLAVVCLSADPADGEAADRLVILRGTRIVVDAPPHELRSGCRRLSYRNEATESREAYGQELDAFFALQVKVRGWGIEAIVTGFDDAAFQTFRSLDGIADAEAVPLTLAELYEAVG